MKSRLWVLVFFGVLFLLFLLPTIDTDFGWQLRCGRELFQLGKLCSPDRYSVLLPGYPWAYPVQVYPWIVAVIFDRFGWWGLSVVNAVIVSGSFILFFWLLGERKELRWLNVILILITIYFSWGVLGLGLRSQIFSIFFFILVLSILHKQRYWWMLPVIFFIWVNTHGGFILGLFVVGVYWVEMLIGRYQGQTLKDLKVWPYFLGSFVVTFINPFTWRVYQEDWLHFGGGYDLAKLIAEWVPPLPQVGIPLFLATILVSLFVIAKRRFTLKTIIFLGTFTYLGLATRRNVPFAWFIIILTAFETRFMDQLVSAVPGKLQAILGKASLGVLLVFIIYIQFPKTVRINTSWQAYCTHGMLVYPCQAIEFMRTQKADKMFALYEWGGFLIWQLPQFPSFVDGRMPAWITAEGKSPYAIYLEMIRTEGSWQKKLDDYQLNYIFIQPGTFMDLKLQPNPQEFGWKELYRDGVAVVYGRK